MELTWGADRLRISLQAGGTGTLLTLTDTFGELGKAAPDAAGWHECLDRLACELGDTAPPGWGQRWRQAHPAYVEGFEAEAATIGPPTG
jgi:hypothetical protein